MKKKVLILDDDWKELLVFEQAFQESEDFELTTAVSSDEVFSLLKQGVEFDIALFDIMLEHNSDLAKEIDGIEVARMVLEEHRFPILLISKNAYEQDYVNRVKELDLQFPCLISKDLFQNNDTFLEHVNQAYSNFHSTIMPPQETIDRLAKSTRKLGIRDKGGNVIRFYTTDQILYCEAEGSYTHIIFDDENLHYMISTHKKNVLRQLHANYINFVEVGKSFIVNLEKIDFIEGQTVYFRTQNLNRKEQVHINISKGGLMSLYKEHIILNTKKRK